MTPGQDEDVERQELQEGGEDRPAPGLLFVPRRQGPLDDVLVRAPVPEADDGRREDHARPGEVGVVGREEEVEMVGPGGLDEGRTSRRS